MKKRLTFIVALLAAGSFAATLEEWHFNDDNGTALNAVTNTGTVGSLWNFGGPQVQTGSLNIGDATYYKWNPSSGTTFRTAAMPEITSGKLVFEFVIADWNLAGSDGLGVPNNGLKFDFGHTTNGSMQLEFEVSQTNTDVRVRSQNSGNGNLSGTDAQNQLGELNLTNTAPVTVQLNVDLDTGGWSTRVDYGNGFVDLVTDGAGMTMIDRIQLIVDSSNGTWEYGGVLGAATEFIKIDSVSLYEWEEDVVDPWTRLEYWDFETDAAGKSFGANWVNSGSLGSVWNFGSPNEISTDGAGLLVMSNHAGQVFRKLPKPGTANANASNEVYNVAFTSGVYRLEMDFASWTLPDGNNSGNLEFSVQNDGIAVALIRLRSNTDGSAAWIQLMGREAGAQVFNTYGQGAGSSNKTTATAAMIEFDFDNDTIEYFINGESKKSAGTFIETGFNQLVFSTDSNWSTNNLVAIESMGVRNYVEPVSETNDTPTSLYNDWTSTYPALVDTNRLSNGDGDGLNNLLEYAWGGDPSDGGSRGNTPIQSVVTDGGTNYLVYVYYELDDADDRGLSSILTVGDDLINTNWSGSGIQFVGSGAGPTGFAAFTNRIPMDQAKEFLRLQVEFTP